MKEHSHLTIKDYSKDLTTVKLKFHCLFQYQHQISFIHPHKTGKTNGMHTYVQHHKGFFFLYKQKVTFLMAFLVACPIASLPFVHYSNTLVHFVPSLLSIVKQPVQVVTVLVVVVVLLGLQ